MPIFIKTISVNPTGDIWWKCDSLTHGQLFTNLKPYTGLGSNDSMVLEKVWADSFIRYTHYKYQQYYMGIKVEAAVYLEQTYGDFVLSSNGIICEGMEQINSVNISESTALATALEHVNAEIYSWEDDSTEYYYKNDSLGGDTTLFPKGELVWAIVGDSICPKNYKLAWKFDVSANVPIYNSDVYIDAKTGVYFKEYSHFKNAIGDFNHFMYGIKAIDTREWNRNPRLWTSTGGFNIKTKDDWWGWSWMHKDLASHPVNSWGNSHWAGTASHWAATESWRLWQWKYLRTGVDDNGKELRVWANAPTDGQGTSFKDVHKKGYDELVVASDGAGNPDGILEASIEIVGHEFAHGVNDYTGNLGVDIYLTEAHALNESYADIFGLMADRYFWGTIRNWQIMDEFGSEIRDFEDPTNFNLTCGGSSHTYPKYYKDSNYFPVDNKTCGGHTNSSVQNRCFYLLANGGAQLSTTVTGIGIDKAELIAQLAFTNFMTPSTTYAQNREQWVKAAAILFGTCSFEVEQTCKAWRACGIGNFCACGNPPCNPCKCVVSLFQGQPPISQNLGIDEKEDKNPLNKIVVYPNPSSYNLIINLTELTQSQKQRINSIEIIDMNGKCIKTLKLNQNQSIIYIADLPNGIYSINIKSSNFLKTLRVIKQ